MMKKLMVLGAGAAGYVLGARAGRERYEQITRQAQRLRNNPTVQQKVSQARHAATDVAKDAASVASTKVRGKPGAGQMTDDPSDPTRVAGTATNGFGRGDDGI